jgi:Uma2 family endonuclease
MTVSEWEALPEDEYGELVDGFLVEEEVPDFIHEAVIGWLLMTFRAWIVPRGGYAFGSEAKFVVGPRRGRKPDLSVFFTRRGRIPRRGAGRMPPDIMVEVVSPKTRDGRRDRVEKVDDYAAFGVAFYWIVDPEQRSIEILERSNNGRSVPSLQILDQRIERVPGCEGLVLDAGALWREMDDLFADEPTG